MNKNSKKRSFAAACVLAGLAQAASATTVPLDTRATFLHTDAETAVVDTVPLDLFSLGFEEGDLIRLEALGDLSFHYDPANPDAALPDTWNFTLGLFSSSVTLLPAENLHRVPGAIDAGSLYEYDSGLTLFGGLPTDIGEDFLITDIILNIPVGGRYLFIAASDIFYSDNADHDGDYAVRITSVPEPGALALCGLGLAAAALMRRRRAAASGN